MKYTIYAAEKGNCRGNLIASFGTEKEAVKRAKKEFKSYGGNGWIMVLDEDGQTIFSK